MISTSNISLRFGKRSLFEDVNLKFTQGDCNNIIAAAELLNGLGINEEHHTQFMKDITGTEKVKVLLAQAFYLLKAY